MKFKLFGTKIYVSFFFCALFTVMLATDRTGLLLPVIFAVIAHETGHLFAMWALDCEPKQIRLIPASVQIIRDFSTQYRNDIIIAACGPLVNFVLALTFYFNYLAFEKEIVYYYALLNLIIGIFNSLPVKGLDGGTILYSVLAKKGDSSRAELTLKLITLITAAIIIIAAVTFTVKGKFNMSFYIIGIYLFITGLIK